VSVIETEPTSVQDEPGRRPGHATVRVGVRGTHQLLDRRRSTALFERAAREAPRLGLLKLPTGQAWLAAAPELARQVLTDNRSLIKGPVTTRTSLLLGDGLLTVTDRDAHRQRRRLVQPAFSRAQIAAYAEQMVDAATAMAQAWAADDGAVRDAGDDMVAVTLGVLGETLLGADTSDDVPIVRRSLTTALRGFEKMLMPGTDRLLRLPIPWARRILAATAALDDVVRRAISNASPPSVTSTLLEASDEGAVLDDEDVRNEVMTLFLAGHETTAGALTWVWWYLGREPHARRALHAELDSVLGVGAQGRDPSYMDLRDLPVTTATFAETLRLRPPVWMLEREVVEPITLDGVVLDRGQVVLVSPYLLHRDPASWPDPLAFDPQRWITPEGTFSEDAPGQPRGAWYPFGGGTRVCIGESFAWAEGVLVLATLARRFAPTLVDPADPGVRVALTLRPDRPVRLRIAAR